MRQLSIALVLLFLVGVGTFYLITQQINLQRYLAPQQILVPIPAHMVGLHTPRPGPSIPPGRVANPQPRRWSDVHGHVGDLRSGTRSGYSRRPPQLWPQVTLPVATPVQITPLPAPTFVSHTMPPTVNLPPPVIPGYQPLVPQANVTASPDHS